MELKKIACPKCGSTVKLDDNLTGGACPSCGFKFAVGADAPLFTEPKDNENRAKENEAAKQQPAKPANSDVDRRLSLAFGSLNRKQWLRASSQFDDVLKSDPDNAEALRGKRLIAQHKTDEPENEPAPAPVPAPAPEPTPAPAPEEKNEESAPAVAVVPVVIPPSKEKEEEPKEEAKSEEPKEEAKPEPEKEEKKEKKKKDKKEKAEEEPVEESVAVTPVIIPDPDSESGRKTESQIANTDRKIVARLSDTTNRKKNQKLLSKSNKALKKKKWKKADRYAERILETDPESAYAFRNKLLAELKLTEERRLAEYPGNLCDHRFFLLALNYSSGPLNRRLSSYADASTRAALAVDRNRAIQEMERLRESEGDIDRRVAAVNASLPADFGDEKTEKTRNRQTSKILDKADAARESKKWKKAEGLYHDALAVDGECADAYLGLLLVSLKLKQEKKLAHCKEPFGTDPNFLLAMHYGSRVMRRRLERYLASAGQKNEDSSSGLIVPLVLPAQEKEAPKDDIEALRNEMNGRLDRIEAMISGVTPIPSDPKDVSDRLATAEREVALTRIYAAEELAKDARISEEERAATEALIHAKELEIIRLRAAMKEADAVLIGEYPSAELRDTAKHLDPIFEKADRFREKGKFGRAADQYDEALALDPTNGRAFIGKLLCDLSIRKEKNLEKSETSFSGNENYVLAVRFSNPDVAKRLQKASDKVDSRLGLAKDEKDKKASKRETKRDERISHSRRDLLIADAEEKAKSAETRGSYLSRKEIERLAENADRFVSRGKFDRAALPIRQLKQDAPASCEGYLYSLLSTMQCRSLSELKKCRHSFRENPDFILALQFCSRSTRRKLKKYADKVDARAKKAGEKIDGQYSALYENEVQAERNEQNEFYREVGDYAEKRRVGNDIYAIKAAAADATRLSRENAEKHKKALKQGYKFLKKGKWEKADACFESVRAEDPANCSAYIGKLLVSLSLTEEKNLGKSKVPFADNCYYIFALCCADGVTAERLRKYCDKANKGSKAKSDPKLTVAEITKRREENNLKTIERLEKRNRELEEELALRSGKGNGRTSGFDDDEDYYLHEGGKFSSLKVFLFLLGFALAVAVVAAGVLLVARYHGSVSDMVNAVKSLKK